MDDRPARGEDPDDIVVRPADDEHKELLDRCKNERDELTPAETADCAGAELVDEYDNEEDGGS